MDIYMICQETIRVLRKYDVFYEKLWIKVSSHNLCCTCGVRRNWTYFNPILIRISSLISVLKFHWKKSLLTRFTMGRENKTAWKASYFVKVVVSRIFFFFLITKRLVVAMMRWFSRLNICRPRCCARNSGTQRCLAEACLYFPYHLGRLSFLFFLILVYYLVKCFQTN